ncbi:hypothetical protein HJFPF1_13099 [Paramyrothecium foliicola]|nr:hypothetical protein HJFPF1_13099 [Paramyrothecium foliicola]
MSSISLHPVAADDLISLFWGTHLDTHGFRGDVSASTSNKKPYFDYFQLQCSYLAQIGGGTDGGLNLITQLATTMKTDIIRYFRRCGQFPADADQKFCESVLDLVARLLVMCDFGQVHNESLSRYNVEWETTSHLRSFVQSYFGNNRPRLQERPRLPKKFDAWSIERIGGITLRFTADLLDHLRLVDDDRTLLIFHHVSFLRFQMEDPPIPTIRILASAPVIENQAKMV